MSWKYIQTSRLRHLFFEGFTALDIAEPLISFDAEADARTVQRFMIEKDFDLVGIRVDGLVKGYVKLNDLRDGICGEHIHEFIPEDDLVPDTANLANVVRSLSINKQCFVMILNQVSAIITLQDLEKPPMRMFLFGLITIGEMLMTEIIRRRYHDGSWQNFLSKQRLQKARDLQEERLRRGQKLNLVDCLQYSDKGWILSHDADIRKALGQESRSAARKAMKELETLRNNLAHIQEVVPTGWNRIAIACSRMEYNLQNIIEKLDDLAPPTNDIGIS